MAAKPRGKPWGHTPKREPAFEDVKPKRRKSGCCRGGPYSKSLCAACPLRPIDSRGAGK